MMPAFVAQASALSRGSSTDPRKKGDRLQSRNGKQTAACHLESGASVVATPFSRHPWEQMLKLPSAGECEVVMVFIR